MSTKAKTLTDLFHASGSFFPAPVGLAEVENVLTKILSNCAVLEYAWRHFGTITLDEKFTLQSKSFSSTAEH